LPGGHVKYKEPVKQALLRELREEMGILDAKVESHVGIIENDWEDKGKTIHENLIIFRVSSKSLNKNENIISREPHLKFCWVMLNELKNLNFLPNGILDFLDQYEKTGIPGFLSLIK
jgi:8-oxo-dGTP pyrophosphatase MutT (NUDIX family)